MRSKLIITLLTVFGIYLIGTLSRDIVFLFQRTKETQKTETELQKVLQEEADLKKQLVYSQSSEFVEKEARDKLGMTKPGETIVILPENVESILGVQDEVKKEPISNWKLWFNLFF